MLYCVRSRDSWILSLRTLVLHSWYIGGFMRQVRLGCINFLDQSKVLGWLDPIQPINFYNPTGNFFFYLFIYNL